jgi:hypothetical protein
MPPSHFMHNSRLCAPTNVRVTLTSLMGCLVVSMTAVVCVEEVSVSSCGSCGGRSWLYWAIQRRCR